jgi:WD40 repeat protein
VNPYAEASFEPTPVQNFQLSKTFKGHVNAISAVAFHPHKNIIATGSDDETWKLWGMPNGELIMSGEGHESWVSSLDFNPRGSHLVTASGDGAIKLWDLAQAKCTTTFAEHSQAVWGAAFHYTGMYVGCLSC